MKTFFVMWIGQFVSLLGSAMTSFAIPIWIFGETGRVQELALLSLAFLLPHILISPFAGTIVDRHNRKLMMIISDLASGLTTIVVLILVLADGLQIWHLYITNAINGTFYTFQVPAYSSSISVMIPKEQYGRASGLTSLAQYGSNVFGPLLAGTLLGFVGLRAILLIDILTFLFAVTSLLFINIPQPELTTSGQQGQGNFWRESAYGFQYILERPSLLAVQLVFLICNFLMSVAFTTLAAMLLFRTDQNASLFAWISAVGAIGGIIGGLVMSAWGGPTRRIHGVLWGWALVGLLGLFPLGVGQNWQIWAGALFMLNFMAPILNGSNQAIWQAKVAPDIQGRVFSIRILIARVTLPFSNVIAIPLADHWLEPAMREGGAFVDSLSWLVGNGPGAGTALLFVWSGLLIPIVALGAYAVSAVREVDTRLLDHDD